MDALEKDSRYWKVMDVCTDLEEGLIDHAAATHRIITLFIIEAKKEEAE